MQSKIKMSNFKTVVGRRICEQYNEKIENSRRLFSVFLHIVFIGVTILLLLSSWNVFFQFIFVRFHFDQHTKKNIDPFPAHLAAKYELIRNFALSDAKLCKHKRYPTRPMKQWSSCVCNDCLKHERRHFFRNEKKSKRTE